MIRIIKENSYEQKLRETKYKTPKGFNVSPGLVIDAISYKYGISPNNVVLKNFTDDEIQDAINEYCNDTENECTNRAKEVLLTNLYLDPLESVRQKLTMFAKRYPLITSDNNTWVFEAPEGATHDDCIEFVDRVVEAVNGRYYGTGRGGSWTAWNIAAPGKIRLKAGWVKYSDDKFFVEIEGVIPG